MHLLTVFLGAILFSTGTLAAPDKNEPQLNILLLTVDSFRPDRLGCYGAARAHTPNIDRLARRGVIFTKAYSTAAWTNASLVSMLTGLYPSVHGVERRGVSVPEEWVTPLELLREAGYLVPEINYLFPTPNYRNLGFTPNRIRDVPQFLVAYQDTAFFAWHHFHGPHLPYNPPEKYLKMFLPADLEKSEGIKAVLDNTIMPRGEYVFTPEERELVNALYNAELAAQDEEIGRVLDTLDSLGLTERTIVILSADHGEELFEHGWLGHASTSLNGTLYEELIRIPLIISLPSRLRTNMQVNSLVQSVDLIPTLFDLLGLELTFPCQGNSFLGLLTGRGSRLPPRVQIFCETSACGYQCPDSVAVTWLRAVSTGHTKLVETLVPGETPRFALFDLETDPGESRDLVRESNDELIRLQGKFAAQVFRNERLREALDKRFALGKAVVKGAMDTRRIEIIFPAEGETITHSAHEGKVPVNWTGQEGAEYIIEYEVGSGKYYLKGSFPVRGSGETFGPFNQIFWGAFPKYNPWRFRVVPEGKAELASRWRTFSFE